MPESKVVGWKNTESSDTNIELAGNGEEDFLTLLMFIHFFLILQRMDIERRRQEVRVRIG